MTVEYIYIWENHFNMRKIKFLFLACILFSLISFHALALGGLEVSLVVLQNNIYSKPYDNKIIVKERPTPFYVELKNTSGSSKLIYRKAQNELAGLEFEVTDENNQKTIVTRKKEYLTSEAITSKHLGAGKTVRNHIVIDHNEWENGTIMKPQKKYKVRVIYNNNHSKIYSDYYTVFVAAPF